MKIHLLWRWSCSFGYACICWDKLNDEYRLTNNDLRENIESLKSLIGVRYSKSRELSKALYGGKPKPPSKKVDYLLISEASSGENGSMLKISVIRMFIRKSVFRFNIGVFVFNDFHQFINNIKNLITSEFFTYPNY